MNETIFKILLVLHIGGGATGLVAGTINMFRPKGDGKHKLVGQFFFYGMLLAAVSALALSVMHPNYFLFITGVFTFYMVSTGKRYLMNYEAKQGIKPEAIDWALSLLMLAFGLAFIGFGIYKLVEQKTFGIVFIAFGAIGLSMVAGDIKNYTRPPVFKNAWLTLHLQRMIGAYIAACTAFLVVNLPNQYLPQNLSFIPWLLPTAVLVPLIFRWTRKYGVKVKTQEVK